MNLWFTNRENSHIFNTQIILQDNHLGADNCVLYFARQHQERAGGLMSPSKSAGVGRAPHGNQSWQELGDEGDEKIPTPADLSLDTGVVCELLQLLGLFWQPSCSLVPETET